MTASCFLCTFHPFLFSPVDCHWKENWKRPIVYRTKYAEWLSLPSAEVHELLNSGFLVVGH